MPVVGTAGHVDHGKSTLIRALTGRDPDRWEEEKRRGLTIDLGFAWTRIGTTDISFVDVPGHERFVKNMLAGIEAVDAAILVIAADEGWMPQTEEHAAVLDLLGIEETLVVITKADRVETTAGVHDAVRRELAGLRFADAPIVDFAAPTNSGLPSLRDALAELIATIPEEATLLPHLWIDRAFTIPGAGTVVTGTLQGGRLQREDRVALQPGGLTGRIRSIQTHEREVDQVEARRRVALNLGGVSPDEVPRGTLLTKDPLWAETDRMLVSLRPARYAELTERGAFHLHMGTGAWPVRLQLLDKAAVLRLENDVPATFGAPFVLRESGRRLVVSGGRILDPHPARRRAALDASVGPLLDARSPSQAANAMLEARGTATPEELLAATGSGEVPEGVRIGRRLYSSPALTRLVESGRAAVQAYHEQFPLRPGMPIASLAGALSLEAGAMEELIDAAGWKRTGPAVALPEHESALTPQQQAARDRVEQTLRAGLRVPRIKELDIGHELLAALISSGSVVRVSDDLVYLPEQLDHVRQRLSEFEEPFTVSDFRQHLDLSRKYAVPLLEWFDRQGVTHRRGDVRTVRSQANPRSDRDGDR